jgi:hypothetical protein
MHSSRRFPIVPCLARLAALLAVPAVCAIIIVAVDHLNDRTRQPTQIVPQATGAKEAVSLLAPRG